LELWAAYIQKPLHPAMIDLCHALGRDIPWIYRWRPARGASSPPELLPERRSEEATGTSPPCHRSDNPSFIPIDCPSIISRALTRTGTPQASCIPDTQPLSN
jgi:hypothetical protein